MLPRRYRCPSLPALLTGLALWLPAPAHAAESTGSTESTRTESISTESISTDSTQNADGAVTTPDAAAANPVTAATEPDPARVRELQAQRSQLEARIEQLQQQDRSAASSVQSGLHEARLALGSVLQELGLHSEASAVWDAAWQARRSDAGLEDPQQLPILRRLFGSQRAAQQWEDADTTAHLIHHIASRAYAPGTAERMNALLLLGRWKLLAASDALLPNPFANAFQAADLYRAEIETLQQTGAGTADPLQIATLHLEKASAEYLLAREVDAQPLQEYFMGGQRTTTMLQCQAIRLADGSTQRICMPVEMPNVDFYVDPSNRKHQDIARFMGAMREDIAAAFKQLSQETEDAEQRDLLLQDLQGLTALYNDFTTRGGSRP